MPKRCARSRSVCDALCEALTRGTTRVDPIPGVRAMLETLTRDPRFALTVLTGNLERAAHLKLHAAGLAEFFTVVRSAATRRSARRFPRSRASAFACGRA